jgi:hypothetical protein
MAKKINQKLLNEELKKFRLLSEYSFYTEEPKGEEDLILGASGIDEADEEPAEEKPAEEQPADDSKTAEKSADAGADAGAEDDSNMFGTNTGDTQDAAPASGAEDAGAEDADADAGTEDAGAEDMGAEDAGAEEEVDIDVTQLVKGSEEAKKSADLSFLKTTELLTKFSELEKRVAAMDSLTSKIDTIEKEIVKRNPTPVEKLEMRSMDSFPYNIKLTDYWKDVQGYDATGEQQPKEYILKKDDVDTGMVDASIKKTFDVPEDYEEEDVYA